MLSKKFIGKCNFLNSTICQELFNMGIIWKFQMTHCLIKNMYGNKLFEIGIIHYFLYVMFLGELGAVASSTVVRLCQFFCCGGKANLVQSFLLNLRITLSYFLLCMDLQPYSHSCFSKISRTLFEFSNNTYWGEKVLC